MIVNASLNLDERQLVLPLLEEARRSDDQDPLNLSASAKFLQNESGFNGLT